MHKIFMATAGFTAIALGFGLTGALAEGRPLTTALTGAAEVPGPGDADASGSADLTINPGREEVCYELSWADVDGTVTASHIHVGDADEPGPVVVPLFVDQSFDGTDSDSGCVSADRDVLVDILRDRRGYYVNVHSTAFPPGAVRGQLG